jgi:hypothetical protein
MGTATKMDGSTLENPEVGQAVRRTLATGMSPYPAKVGQAVRHTLDPEVGQDARPTLQGGTKRAAPPGRTGPDQDWNRYSRPPIHCDSRGGNARKTDVCQPRDRSRMGNTARSAVLIR